MRRKWFTLVEIIIAMTCACLLFVAVIGIYNRMIKLKYQIQARTNLIQDSYYALEKINLLLKDYTIDYEEYFDRANVGCNSLPAPFLRDIWMSGYCSFFTAYGNNNALGTNVNLHERYYCSSQNAENTPAYPFTIFKNVNVGNGSGCANTWQQSFGQYQWQFRDAKDDVNSVLWSRNDDDDTNVMRWPDAVVNATGVQELYLISQDGKQRVFLRRALVASGDWDHDGIISGDSEMLYTLEILKLRGFDAGNHHDFDIVNSSGVYDGKIDTWACDYAQGFLCNGTGIGWAYTWFNLPLNSDDGRVHLFNKNITISNWNLIIYPTKNPEYALAEDAVQINPYFTISLTSKLYGEIWFRRFGMPAINDFQLGLQTTFDTKNHYTTNK